MAELRAGGLALIVESINPEDVGKCVTTISLIPAHGSFTSPHGRPTNNNADFAAWFVTGDVKALMGKGSPVWAGRGWSLYPPQYLMPIDGDDFTHEDEREKELVNG
ncbi:hypothetical protein [Pectobacterium versatile]|uniref:hypothetical protein n=1 Tax=Pectobacterium versatile TaxID=2488639 RepID=UPI001F443010|nr:hypothetical protein [Pectobacterium versatile]